ncbi:MAG: GNAT family N-acetyltransferase [Proteobacteria bacterium]|nr:GNAT family N-acetyltransferase [Pseudomonadota bacterium]
MLAINAKGIPGVAPLDEVELERLMLLPNAHLAIGPVDDELLGYALAFPDHARYDGEEFQVLLAQCPRPFLYIDQVAIAPNMRRKGIARVLYSALEDEARERTMSGLCCEINLHPPNPVSVSFHRSLGFEQVGKLETSDGRTVALMQKSIK